MKRKDAREECSKDAKDTKKRPNALCDEPDCHEGEDSEKEPRGKGGKPARQMASVSRRL